MLAAVLLSSLLSASPSVVSDPDLEAMKSLSKEELRDLLKGLLLPRAGASSLTHSRVLALRAIVDDDEGAALALAHFPAQLVVTLDGGGKMEAAAFRNALTRVFREAGLALVREETGTNGILRVHVQFEVTPDPTLFQRDSVMKSFTATVTGALESRDGSTLLRFADANAMLGINLGFGAQRGVDRTAGKVCDAVVREMAISVSGGIPRDTSDAPSRFQSRQLEAAQEQFRKLQARTEGDPAAAAVLAASPFALTIVAGKGVSPHNAAVFEYEVKRVLQQAGVPLSPPEGPSGAIRIVYDVVDRESSSGPLDILELRTAMRASTAEGETLATRAGGATVMMPFSAHATFARELRHLALVVARHVVVGLAEARLEEGEPSAGAE